MAFKQSAGEKIFERLNHIILLIFGLSTVYPFVYIITLSFNDGLDALKGGIYLWPRVFTLDNYIKCFQNELIFNSYMITVFRTIVGTFLATLLCSMLAFALTKKKLPGRSAILFFFFFTTIFSGGLIPYYILLRQLNLTNSIWVYVIPQLYSFYNVIILKTYFETIPKSISESAVIDGCSDVQIFSKIYLPLSGPVIATILLFFGVAHWNDWFTGTYFVQDKRLFPAATMLQNLLTESTYESSTFDTTKMNTSLAMSGVTTTPESLKMAFIVIMTLPIVFVYPFLQKYFIKGVMIGAIKG
ncbi:MAG TPA: carbohydrate ABC transporter permease [Bacillota bacterium]